MRFYILIILAILFSCKENPQNFSLQTGDILFRMASSESLSQAIDAVTQTDSVTHFSHMGMALKISDSLFVLHSDTESGSSKITLKDFVFPNGENRVTVAYRLKPEYQNSIPQAVKTAQAMLGKPYNFTYVMNDSTYYCSDFIYRAFAKDSIFKLNPMTFKNPETGTFEQGWVDFYKKLGMPIPEGKLGCNPNGMATSDKLIKLGKVPL